MTPRSPKGFGTGGQRFGTGADPETVIKTEGPGILRTIVNGMAFATGFLIVGAIGKKIGEAWSSSDSDYDVELDQYVDDDSDFTRRDYLDVEQRRLAKAREARIRKLEKQMQDDEIE